MMTNQRAAKIFIITGLILGSVLGLGLGYVWGTSSTVSIAKHNSALLKVKGLEGEARKLAGELSASGKEVRQLKTDLGVETTRKNQLAVENTRLLGRVSQGQKDLSIVVSKQPVKVTKK